MTDKLILSGQARKYLRGLAHSLKPVVLIGQKGTSPSVSQALEQALLEHELVKVKFVEGKTKDQKNIKISMLEKETGAIMVGMIGHIAIFYRPHPEADKRKITLPSSIDK
jgi:RNA-binding protein